MKSSETKKILFVHPGTELYGSDRMAVETVAALIDGGYSVTVVVPDDGPLIEHFRAVGAQVQLIAVPVLRKEYLHPARIWGLAARSLSAARIAHRQVRSSGARLVYVNTIIQPVWMIAARLARVKLICHVRETENGLPLPLRAGLLWPATMADLLISNSRSTERFVITSSVRKPREHCVVYNGKNWDSYFSEPPAPLSKSPSIVVVGRLSPRKGQHTVVAALGILAVQGIRAKLTLVGDTFAGYEWYAEQLRADAARLNVTDQCEFIGFSDDIQGLLAAADIAVVPSLIEPFGTVAAESMAAMRPTIASRTEGLAEIIDHERTGLLVAPDDAEDLATAIRRLVDDPALAESLARAGYNAVREQFSAGKYRKSIVDATTNLLEGAK